MIRAGMVALCLALAASAPAWADDSAMHERSIPASEVLPYTSEALGVPEIGARFEFSAGFRVGQETGEPGMADHYMDLDDSPLFSFTYIHFPFPHRIHMDAEYAGQDDRFADIGYAYSDVVLARYVERALHHSTGRVELITDGVYAVAPRGTTEEYGVRGEINDFTLRLKTPQYPAHLTIAWHNVRKSGDAQARHMGGTAWAPGLVRVSDSQEIDWETDAVSVTLNAHIGPVEAEYSHEEKRYTPSGQRAFSEAFLASAMRAAGTYPVIFMPELEGSTDTLRMHTTYTGRVVGAMTLSQTSRENTDSGATSDETLAAGSLTFRPLMGLLVVVKADRSERETGTPSQLPAGYLGYADYTAALTGIQDSPDTTRQSMGIVARYRPVAWLTTGLDIKHDETERTDASTWDMPAKTTRDTVALSAHARLPERLRVRARYETVTTDDPVSTASAEDYWSALLSATWSPARLPKVHVSYTETEGTRGADASRPGTLWAMDSSRSTRRYMARVHESLGPGLVVYGSYTRLEYESDRGILIDTTPDRGVLEESATIYTAGATLKPDEGVTVEASASWTFSRGQWRTAGLTADEYADSGMAELDYTLTGRFTLGHGWSAEATCRYIDVDDLATSALNPAPVEASARIVSFQATKTFF